MHPVNRQSSMEVRKRMHHREWVLLPICYVVGLITLLILFSSFQVPVGGVVVVLAAFPAIFLFLMMQPILILTHKRAKTQHDFPAFSYALPTWDELAPQWKHIPSQAIHGTSVHQDDYPLVKLLDPNWYVRYQYLAEADVPDAISEMCSEVLRNWNGEHPDAPVSARKPAWFENLDEQAETLIRALQTARDVVLGNTDDDAERYFRQHGRWPESWYLIRHLPVPPPGPDPDWFVPSLAGTAISGAVVVGSLYLGVWRPISRALGASARNHRI